MTSRMTMLPLACFAAMMLSGFQAPVHATEIVHFTSEVLPPSALKLRQAKAQGKELKREPGFPLWGHLNKPSGPGPFPAVVLMHGCSGIRPTHARWASQLTRGKSLMNDNLERIFDDKTLLNAPVRRAAYSDRTAWLMAAMSQLAYYKFEGEQSLKELAVELSRLSGAGDIESRRRAHRP